MKTSSKISPTLAQSKAFQACFDYFNRELFGGELSQCMLNFSRKSKAMGFFVSGLWGKRSGDATGRVHEISLNPDFLDLPVIDSAQTIVHEMAHLWQQERGTPPRKCYHDREWAAKMEGIGLVPSDTGEPGGKKTGQKMSDYVAPGGQFEAVFKRMPKKLLLPWLTVGRLADDDAKKEKKKSNKTKYVCPGCEANVWGKPDLNIMCGECDRPFEAASKEE